MTMLMGRIKESLIWIFIKSLFHQEVLRRVTQLQEQTELTQATSP
jgi:hypothetical protein